MNLDNDSDNINSKKSFNIHEYLKEHSLLARIIVRNQILFECHGEAPSPSKDYGQIEINFDQIIIRWWKITLRNIEGSIYPGQIKNSYEDFLYDEIAHREINRIFGKKIVNYCLNIVSGQIDLFKYLPLNIQIKIFSLINIDDIPQISLVSKLFRLISLQVRGWRYLFFTNKLKLQMELRRQALLDVYQQQENSFDLINKKEHRQQFLFHSSSILNQDEQQQ
ncbi:unnamed protein product [Rotaria magnacalcarata]|nr:unnamed protein product [Rotaria magnacalcarata]CAF3834732.1 unnamed protein product [Rotaria magnacalcarata]CAF3912970.1 unnamed protein product [Rotaria magnacalcarata]CAF4049870.1 unnamed protein product [Rotaria magnacalcarata]CAF4068352.1 unnamed protein product [Rotaria magnacalcarata]